MDMIHEVRKTKCAVAHALFNAIATPKLFPNIRNFENDIAMSKLMHTLWLFIYFENSSLNWVSLSFWIYFHVPWHFWTRCSRRASGLVLPYMGSCSAFSPTLGIHFEFEFSRVWQLARNWADPHHIFAQLVQNASWMGRRGYYLTDNEWILIVFRGGSLLKAWKLSWGISGEVGVAKGFVHWIARSKLQSKSWS